jgi:hypothetical protein
MEFPVKLISWNLRNIGQNKLKKGMNATLAAAGYGNTVLDFMMKVVMGDPIWLGRNLTLAPADLFLVIELKCGGYMKGNAVTSGTGIGCMADILTAMETYTTNAGIQDQYEYAEAPKLLIGSHETVGLIYNTKALEIVDSSARVLRDNGPAPGRFLLPRTPYLVQFTQLADNSTLNVVGLHAPPPKGSGDYKFQVPIAYCNQLPSCPQLMLGGAQHYFIGGDFNCAPNSSCPAPGNFGELYPFTNPSRPGKTLTGYGTSLTDGTLTSVRRKVDKGKPAGSKDQYLSGAYDNILSYPQTTYLEYTIDLIGDLNVTGAQLVACLNNYNIVSDHLPVALDYIPAHQKIVFRPQLPQNARWGQDGPWTLAAVASSGLPVAYTVQGPASLFGKVLTLTGRGAVTVKASVAGNNLYSAADDVTKTINVT